MLANGPGNQCDAGPCSDLPGHPARVLGDRTVGHTGHAARPAQKILTELLDGTARPLLGGGFDAFARCFHLPQTLTTTDGMRLIRTREELRQLFYDLRGYYGEIGVEMLTRQPVRAEFANEHTILAVHQTFVIGQQGLMRDPYEVLTILQRKEGIWAASYSDSALGGDLQGCIEQSRLHHPGQVPVFNPPIIRGRRKTG